MIGPHHHAAPSPPHPQAAQSIMVPSCHQRPSVMVPVPNRLHVEFPCLTIRCCLHVCCQRFDQHRRLRPLGGLPAARKTGRQASHQASTRHPCHRLTIRPAVHRSLSPSQISSWISDALCRTSIAAAREARRSGRHSDDRRPAAPSWRAASCLVMRSDEVPLRRAARRSSASAQ